MPLLYGEGERAFKRLQHEIIKETTDQSLFAWNNPYPAPSGVLPLNRLARFPAVSKDSEDAVAVSGVNLPYLWTNKGLCISLHLTHWEGNHYIATLDCRAYGDGTVIATRA